MSSLVLRNNGWITVPWAEFVSKDGSKGSTFTSGWNDDSHAAMHIVVNWSDWIQAEQDILGIASWDPVLEFLYRTPPVQHPYKHQLRAEKILATQPMRFNGKTFTNFEYAWSIGGAQTAYAKYIFMMISIGFSVPKYAILTDTDLQINYGSLEFNRWCEVVEDQHLETITREAGSFVWQAGPHNGQPFVAPLGQHFPSSTFKVLWKRVPRFGLFEDNGLGFRLNQNIRNNVGSVHNGATPLFGIANVGIPANNNTPNANANGSSLRLASVRQTPVASPLAPPVQGLPWKAVNTYHDVEFTFHLWDPPSGDNVNFGHNLAPAPEVDGKWYLVKTPGGATIYPVSDLTTIFELARF